MFWRDSMKIVAKPIEMIAWTDINGKINPVRFKLTKDDESSSVVKIDKVITVEKEKLAGNDMLVYKCQSVIKEVDRLYEIKYELSSCKWILYKI
jgi:hypothetical protein